MKNWKTWPLHCWLAWAFHCSNITSADTASSSPIPVIVKKQNKSGQFQNWIPAHSIVPNWTKQRRLLSTWYGLGLHQVVLTKGFEHSRLLSVSRFCPINNISKLCEHLGLKNKRSPIIIAYYIYMYIRQKHTSHLIKTFRKHNDRLTPERMTSPDSAIAPSLLSTYTTASFINMVSSSRQFGLQAPTAAQQQEGNREVKIWSDVTHFFLKLQLHCKKVKKNNKKSNQNLSFEFETLYAP